MLRDFEATLGTEELVATPTGETQTRSAASLVLFDKNQGCDLEGRIFSRAEARYGAARASEMDKDGANFHGQLIKNAQILFKLSFGFSATLPELGYLSSFASYRHTAHADELKLTREEEGIGSSLLEHVATYILVVQIDAALGALYPNRFESADQMLRSAAWIARLIRNAFAHNPFAPQWKTYLECENKQFTVPNVISLDTSGLNGKFVDRAHYGGPLALLKLSEFVRGKLEHD